MSECKSEPETEAVDDVLGVGHYVALVGGEAVVEFVSSDLQSDDAGDGDL